MVREDAENDVKDFDGRELTGRLIGEINGNTNGLIVGLANCIETLAYEIDRLEDRMPPQQGWW
ncbi:Uncharacterised protein [Mycobacteroides abscessus subsp. bolletii]|nr:Uncharacterised protein [Mycobacteroides abscessus subsp. bolletii]SKS03095.1 Uncharacterised protein [Mycobacteroides abscessus subsp. bolletii]